MTHELHPLCSLFPRMTGAEFDTLRDDIKTHGLQQPIVLHDGMILDGGNRYRACVEAGVEPAFRTFDGANIVSFVLSANLHRRHMSAGQQAAIVASATDWAKAQKQGRPEKPEGPPVLSTVSERAVASGANERTQRDADKLARDNPAKAKEVAQGKTSLYRAVKEARPVKSAKPPKPEPPKTAKQIEAARLDEKAFGGLDPAAVHEQERKVMDDELRELRALLDVADADDQKAEALKWRRAYDSAVRAQAEAMDRVLLEQKMHAFKHRQLMRCGKALGIEDPDKIAPAVEAFVRQSKQVAA